MVLAVAFVLVAVDRFFKARSVARATAAAADAPPVVDVVQAQPVGAVQRLALPGYTAAWHASTIYARVDGYVGKLVRRHRRSRACRPGAGAHRDTRSRCAAGGGARAAARPAQAQVLVRKAEADFSLSTYERWRDSPQGVVSEQEREEKNAPTTTARSRG